MFLSYKSFLICFIDLVFRLSYRAYAFQFEPLSLSLPGDEGRLGELDGPGAAICYNLTFSDYVLRQVVWWDRGRLSVRVEPCIGKPHMKISVYGCPSDGARVVWEYMNAQMQGAYLVVPVILFVRTSTIFMISGDIADSGGQVPAEWQWVGDTESLLIEITHRTYFIEVDFSWHPNPTLLIPRKLHLCV